MAGKEEQDLLTDTGNIACENLVGVEAAFLCWQRALHQFSSLTSSLCCLGCFLRQYEKPLPTPSVKITAQGHCPTGCQALWHYG